MSKSSGRVRLSVISVTYNSESVIGQMLGGVAEIEGVEVIVVDNASSDGTVETVRRRFPSVEVIANAQNLGFAAAVNLGAIKARGDVLLLLNPDAHIAPSDVDLCLASLANNSQIGVLAPRVRQPVGRLRVMEAGREPNIWRLATHFSGLSRFSRWAPGLEGLYLINGHVSESRAVDWVSGACMFVRKETWDELDGLSERWFMYAEDIEFCLRAQDADFTVHLFLGAEATHLMGASSTQSPAPTETNSAWIVNLYDLYKKRNHASRARSWAWRTIATLGMLSRSSAYRLKSSLSHGTTVDWRREAAKFDAHARAIRQTPLR